MTATRIVRAATIAVAAAGWVVAAVLLWRTKVPNLQLPHLAEDAVFGARAVASGEDYDRFVDVVALLAVVAAVAALVVMARRGSRLARSLPLGRVNAGIVVAVVTAVVLWAVSLPFDFAAAWWARRHGISLASYGSIVGNLWLGVYAVVFGTFVGFALILLLAKRLGDAWWVGFAAIAAGLTFALVLAIPFLQRIDTDPPPAKLSRVMRELERRERVTRPAVRVVDVDDETTAANAESTGIGPSRTIFFWNTLLDGRFSGSEVRFVAAHELGHLARHHVWKGIGWGLLAALPTLAATALLTGRRGGLPDPGLVPYAFLVLTVLGLALTPLENVVSRRYEAEADWLALQATRDPSAGRDLFRHFVRFARQDPSPPGWAHAFFDTHPTALQRVEMMQAWRLRGR